MNEVIPRKNWRLIEETTILVSNHNNPYELAATTVRGTRHGCYQRYRGPLEANSPRTRAAPSQPASAAPQEGVLHSTHLTNYHHFTSKE